MPYVFVKKSERVFRTNLMKEVNQMKKILALCLTVVLCLCCLASCGSAHKENKWFSEEKLTQCLVGELPTIEKEYVNHNGEDI